MIKLYITFKITHFSVSSIDAHWNIEIKLRTHTVGPVTNFFQLHTIFRAVSHFFKNYFDNVGLVFTLLDLLRIFQIH